MASSRGHRLATRCDTEAWVHLYEELGERVFLKAEGQFSVSLWDQRERKLMLARDRVGIGPLFYAQRDGWLLWSSEIKGLLASGMIDAEPDPRGLDYFFNFFSLPYERTCFAGIRQLPPGHYAVVKDGELSIHQYWDLEFPESGAEQHFNDPAQAAAELEELLRGAVRRRLASEVPVSCYLSGGLDSTVVLALACQERGEPLPSFTIGLDRTGPLDERAKAAESARFFGSPNRVVNVSDADICAAYPRLVVANEAPDHGHFLRGDGPARRGEPPGRKRRRPHRRRRRRSAGRLCLVQVAPRRPISNLLGNPIERFVCWFMSSRLVGGGSAHRAPFHGAEGHGAAGVRFAQQISWELIAQSRERLYSPAMWDRLGSATAYADLPPLPPQIDRWHPLNQSLYAAYKVMLPGLLLAGKGDRPLRTASTEGRYPFLDEKVVEFCSRIAPQYKLRGNTDKWLLREVAERVAPRQVRSRRKVMFRANLGTAFLGPQRPAWVDQLLSPESLAATGYFDPRAVEQARAMIQTQRGNSLRRFVFDMSLAGVISTQLWHHLYCGGGLCELPTWTVADQTRKPVGVPSVA